MGEGGENKLGSVFFLFPFPFPQNDDKKWGKWSKRTGGQVRRLNNPDWSPKGWRDTSPSLQCLHVSPSGKQAPAGCRGITAEDHQSPSWWLLLLLSVALF